MVYKTEQEEFWAGEFGRQYSSRNQGAELGTSKLLQFGHMLRRAPGIASCVELGCNVGLNLAALRKIYPEARLAGYEINDVAAGIAREAKVADIFEGTILDPIEGHYDLSFICCVLIHIDPGEVQKVYDNLYNLSGRYILVNEYYNPSPVTVTYRGTEDRLFKRDFAGELIDRYGLRLLDYGFFYRRDNCMRQLDDSTWFLLEKADRPCP